MFQSKKPKSSRGVRHVRKFGLRKDASRDTQCSGALNTQLYPEKLMNAVSKILKLQDKIFKIFCAFEAGDIVS